jgi:hypothetical protein
LKTSSRFKNLDDVKLYFPILTMKRLLHFFAFLLLSFNGLSQDKTPQKVKLNGEISVSPSGEIWLAQYDGRLFFTKDIGSLWHEVAYKLDYKKGSLSSGGIRNIHFFSEDTLIISGDIKDTLSDKQIVYWSGNHGKNWEKIEIAEEFKFDATHFGSDKIALLCGSSQLNYLSHDAGKTWKTINKIEASGNLRINTIHFSNNEKIGLLGSHWNVLYRTDEHCEHWEKLPTPLSQNKYQRISKEERPEIDKVRIFGSHYAIQQQGRTFVTKSDSIDWKKLKQVLNFEVTENEGLYVVYKDFTVELFDSNFASVWKSEKKIKSEPRSITVRDNSLFVLAEGSIYKINPQEFTETDIKSNDIRTEEDPNRPTEPYQTVSYHGEKYGNLFDRIVIFNKKSKKWDSWLLPDFSIGYLTVWNDQLVVSNNEFSKIQYYYVNVQERKLDEIKDVTKLFVIPEFDKLVKFDISFVQSGCFHFAAKKNTYTKSRGEFILSSKMILPLEKAKSKKRSVPFLAKMSKTIDAKKIEELLTEINTSKLKINTVGDLQLTQNDISEFKKFIDDKATEIKKNGISPLSHYDDLYAFPGENTDFNFYKKIADTLLLNPEFSIHEALYQGGGIFSTSSEDRRLTFTFNNEKTFSVSNSDTYPNYLHSPWTLLAKEQLLSKVNSLGVGKLVNEITNGDFLAKKVTDKNYAIFRIADYYYKKKLEDDK